MSAPLSGPSGHIGISLLEGIQPTIININQKGGIDGRPIELVVLDDQYNPKKTIQNTIALVKEKKGRSFIFVCGNTNNIASRATIDQIQYPLLSIYRSTCTPPRQNWQHDLSLAPQLLGRKAKHW